MTTLGALLVGLLLLLALLGVLAWMQRRSRRGPEQPRTVADLVRMRETVTQSAAAPVEVAALPVAVETADAGPVAAEPVPTSGSQDQDVVASPDAAESADASEPEDEVAPSTAPRPEDAAVDTPWARAARMTEPWPEWCATPSEEPPQRPLLSVTSAADRPEPTHPSMQTEHAGAVAQDETLAPPSRTVDAATSDRPPAGPSEGRAASGSDTGVRGPVPASSAPDPIAAERAAEPPVVEPEIPHPATNGHRPVPTLARVAGRSRCSPSATAAEQAAADLALLRTFGVRPAAEEPEVELEGCAADDDEPVAGTAQPVAFRVLGRDGHGIAGATVTLLDDHGRETASTRTDPDGHGVLTARHPGGYLLVVAAEGHQPGAITVAVTDEPVDAEIPLTRSASVAGTVAGEDGPIVGATLALVQDGEIVATAQSTVDGTYRFADLAAGEYGLSVTAHECESAALVLELADEADLRQDVELDPAGLPADDVMIGH